MSISTINETQFYEALERYHQEPTSEALLHLQNLALKSQNDQISQIVSDIQLDHTKDLNVLIKKPLHHSYSTQLPCFIIALVSFFSLIFGLIFSSENAQDAQKKTIPAPPSLPTHATHTAPFQPVAPSVTPTPKPHGLPNLGNTCFGNAVLQAFLLSGGPLAESVEKPIEDNRAAELLRGILRQLKDEWEKPSPDQNQIKENLNLLWDVVNTHAQHRGSSLRAKGPQQDASELLSLILDVLSKKKPQKHFFYARKQLTHRSTGNDTLTKNLEKTPVLSLSGLKPNQPTSLQTLLRQTLAEEVFDQKENSTFAKSQTVLQTANSDAPEFLSVQLPRFKFEKGRSQKIQNPITELDQIVSVPFRDQNGQECLAFYQVMSVVHHRGATLNVGHYTASVQDHNGNWTMRNDNSVSNQKQQDALNGQTAYLLRLKKVDEDYIPPISHA